MRSTSNFAASVAEPLFKPHVNFECHPPCPCENNCPPVPPLVHQHQYRGYAVMLGVTRSRSHRQYIRRRGQKREVSNHGNVSAASVRLLVLCAALASAIGGGGQGRVTAISSGHRPGFLGLGFGREKAPAVPEPPSLGDRVRSLGERVRTGGAARLATGKGGGSRSGGAGEAKAMAAAQVRSEGQQAPTGRSNGRNSFIAGGLAGSISMTITCPIEVSHRIAAAERSPAIGSALATDTQALLRKIILDTC